MYLYRRLMTRQLGFQTLVFLAKILNSCQVTAIVIGAYKQLLFPVHTYSICTVSWYTLHGRMSSTHATIHMTTAANLTKKYKRA